MSAGDAAAPYFDLSMLRWVRAVVARLDPAGAPEAVVLVRAWPPPPSPPLKREGCFADTPLADAEEGDAGEVGRPPGPPILGGERRDDAAATRVGIGVAGPFSPQGWGAGGAAARQEPLRTSPAADTPDASHDSRLTPHDSVAIIAGSFDPPTNAHLALARAAREAGGCDVTYLALSRHTVDKETRTRPSDVDRAILLGQIAAREPGLGVLLFNRGLYADQAVAARAAFPGAAISFVVGFDKARQIFDPRYYADRDAALHQLFAHVSLLVAPRAEDGPDALNALLDRPENAPFRASVRALPFDPAWAADSSTVVRAAARAGEPFAAIVPPETVAFVAALDPYVAPDRAVAPDRYARREALLARLIDDPAAPADLRPLLT